MPSVAWPRETPGARLNEIVTDGKLALVIHRQRYVRGLEVSERRQRYGCAAGGAQINILQRLGRLLELRRDFHDHVVLVERTVHGGNLPLPEGVVERVINILRRNSQPAGGVAVNHQLRLQSFILLVSIYVAQFRQAAHFLQQQRTPVIEFIQVLALYRVLVLRLPVAPANRQVLLRLQEQRGSRNHRKFTPQSIDHIVGAEVARVPEVGRLALAAPIERLQHDEEPPLIGRSSLRPRTRPPCRPPDPSVRFARTVPSCRSWPGTKYPVPPEPSPAAAPYPAVGKSLWARLM